MVRIEEFHERKESIELSEFHDLCMCHIDTAKDQLLKQFVVFCCFLLFHMYLGQLSLSFLWGC